jgi:fido (protein-threonine AMPylation protein)
MSYPEWHPHDHQDYDAVLRHQSAIERAQLMDGGRRAAEAFLRDTRATHLRLYEKLAPSDHREYAGTYRGTVGTSLEARRAGSNLVTREGNYFFIEPEKVKPCLDKAFGDCVNRLLSASSSTSPYDHFILAAKAFYIFGLIHPYLDGNGHIQRLVFAASVSLFDKIVLLDTWTIHPRPYDKEMAQAFEQERNALGAVTKLLRCHVAL